MSLCRNSKSQLCTFFVTGGCSRGDSCPFSHDLSNAAPPDGASGASFCIIDGVHNLPQHIAAQNKAQEAKTGWWNSSAASSSSKDSITHLSDVASDTSSLCEGISPRKQRSTFHNNNGAFATQHSELSSDTRLRADAPSWMPSPARAQNRFKHHQSYSANNAAFDDASSSSTTFSATPANQFDEVRSNDHFHQRQHHQHNFPAHHETSENWHNANEAYNSYHHTHLPQNHQYSQHQQFNVHHTSQLHHDALPFVPASYHAQSQAAYLQQQAMRPPLHVSREFSSR